MLTKDAVLAYAKAHGATHVRVLPSGTLVAYRPAETIPNWWACCTYILHCAPGRVGSFFYTDHAWLLCASLHHDAVPL